MIISSYAKFCRNLLKRFEEDQFHHVFDIITGDETWFYHYDSETREQSKTDPRPTKVHRSKRMMTMFLMKSDYH
jgi:hypothetical protein